MAQPPRALVYFTVGGDDPGYVELLAFCVNTLRCHPYNRRAAEVLVLCDAGWARHLREAGVAADHVVEAPRDEALAARERSAGARAAARKLALHALFPAARDAARYDVVLYLDCDLCVCGSLEPLLDAARGVGPGRLCIVPEMDGDPAAHRMSRFFASRPYSAEELWRLALLRVPVFNSGQFAWRVAGGGVACAVERAMADALDEMRATYDAALHLYEQPFLNRVVAERLMGVAALAPYVRLLRAGAGLEGPRRYGLVNHFIDSGVPWADKLRVMRACHAARLAADPPARLPTRAALPALLGLPPGAARAAEIGTFAGDYAAALLEGLRPASLLLVDTWPAGRLVASGGDQDGNGAASWREGGELHAAVAARFARERAAGVVALARKRSDELTDADAAPGSLDLVYVGGEHAHEAVARDLRVAWRLLKARDAALCGHGYAANPAKAARAQPECEGVRRAVDEFCAERGVRVWALLEDGRVSYVVLR